VRINLLPIQGIRSWTTPVLYTILKPAIEEVFELLTPCIYRQAKIVRVSDFP
jgi:hypothetical protein